MSRRTTRSEPSLLVVAVLAVILFFVGRAAWQWFTAPEPERGPTLAEQVEAIPGVAEVEVGSERVPGPGAIRGAESTVIFDEQILDDPRASAEELAAVSFGWNSSTWSFEQPGSTAHVQYVSQLDPAPFAWWLKGVAALKDAEPAADLACDIRYGSLACQVNGGDADMARDALAGVDGSDVQAWINQSSPDTDQPHGFVLIVGGERITDIHNQDPGGP